MRIEAPFNQTDGMNAEISRGVSGRLLPSSMRGRSRWLGVGAAAALLIATAAFGSQVAKADSPNSAVVIKDTGCIGLDGNGHLVPLTGRSVVTSSGTGVFICEGDVPPSSTGRAVEYDFNKIGLPCSTKNGLTNMWRQVVSAAGRAILICVNKRN